MTAAPLTPIIGAIIIAASVAFFGRYEISATSYGFKDDPSNSTSEVVYRLDRWTGEIRECGVNMTDPDDLRRHILQDGAMIASCEYSERVRPIAGVR